MAQEFVINSQAIENKINQLLPSQGGFGAGIDFSASTMVIPIVDLTESAEGSGLRADLQTALSHTSSSHNLVENATVTLVSTTGYYLVNIGYVIKEEATNDRTATLQINDGTTNKVVWQMSLHSSGGTYSASGTQSIIVLLNAGDSLVGVSSAIQTMLNVVTRQIATLDGTLVDPT